MGNLCSLYPFEGYAWEGKLSALKELDRWTAALHPAIWSLAIRRSFLKELQLHEP